MDSLENLNLKYLLKKNIQSWQLCEANSFIIQNMSTYYVQEEGYGYPKE